MNLSSLLHGTATVTQAINSNYTKFGFSLVLSIVFSIGVILFNYTKYSLVLDAPARIHAYAHARGGAR